MPDYFELPGLENVYLEDSYITALHEGDHEISFQLDAVLTEGHPRWHPPRSGEQYCYVGIDLTFREIESATWLANAFQRAVDAAGEVDYGNIDAFTWKVGRYELSGDGWHVLIFASGPPDVALR